MPRGRPMALPHGVVLHGVVLHGGHALHGVNPLRDDGV